MGFMDECKSNKQTIETHPHPSLPLEGEGVELRKPKCQKYYSHQCAFARTTVKIMGFVF
jgi:hypothetical protein